MDYSTDEPLYQLDDKAIKNFIFVSIISADNYRLTEEVKQAIISRYKDVEHKEEWEYILEPIEDERYRKSLIQLLS